ncbi:hypothetical protein ZOSMA_83G00530 [Zostera marina]|uniref:Uncharacterized protein n=1 Tax=Zostera marina TaxID=29655 RepID=A0A0K9NLQ9_ZOSMR|nr:hypothetical protein ZOSMA_83G00530 [Zostera marina]
MDTFNLSSSSSLSPHRNIQLSDYHARRTKTAITFSSKPGANTRQVMSMGSCKTCKGKGAVECLGCKGTGRNKKNGNIFERWKCFECQGFGMKSCPSCGKEGLTPEQRGER